MKQQTPKQAPRQVSIKRKIFLYLLGFCLLLLGTLWVFQTVMLERFYTAIKLRQVAHEAGELAALLQAGNDEAFEEKVHRRGDMYVELVYEDGSSTPVDGFLPEFGMTLWNEAQRAELFAEAKAEGGSLSRRYSADEFLPMPEDYAAAEDARAGRAAPEAEAAGELPTEAGPPLRDGPGRWQAASVLHAILVTPPAGLETLLLVRAATTPVNATVATLRVQLWWISGIMLALAVGIAVLLSRRVAGPIERLNNAAGELARGNYEVRFDGGGYREAEQLSCTLNQAAEELSKTDTLRRDLIANVSHDLRTPLTLITGYAEMMRDLPGENTPENMQVIIDEGRRLRSLVCDLLDLSQLQSGTVALQPEAMDLTSEVRAVIERLARFSEAEGYTVRYEATGPAEVQADRARIAQVVYNFLLNAMAHTGEDKRITVQQSVAGGRVRLAVQDSGPGIPPEQLPYVWERYYKLGEPHRRLDAGAGLGLSIVKSILEQHPGVQYGVDSHPGTGSSFWFSLPLA